MLGSTGCGAGTESGDFVLVVYVDAPSALLGEGAEVAAGIGSMDIMGELEGVGWRLRCCSSALRTSTGIDTGSGKASSAIEIG